MVKSLFQLPDASDRFLIDKDWYWLTRDIDSLWSFIGSLWRSRRWCASILFVLIVYHSFSWLLTPFLYDVNLLERSDECLSSAISIYNINAIKRFHWCQVFCVKSSSEPNFQVNQASSSLWTLHFNLLYLFFKVPTITQSSDLDTADTTWYCSRLKPYCFLLCWQLPGASDRFLIAWT